MKQKKLIGSLIFLVCLILGTILIIIYNNKTQTQKPIEKKETQKETIIYNPNITEEKNIDNIIFKDIECSYDGFYSLLTYKIINKTNNTINLGEYEIVVKDKDNNILANISPSITEDLKPNEEIETGNAIDIDLSNATSMELIIEK